MKASSHEILDLEGGGERIHVDGHQGKDSRENQANEPSQDDDVIGEMSVKERKQEALEQQDDDEGEHVGEAVVLQVDAESVHQGQRLEP